MVTKGHGHFEYFYLFYVFINNITHLHEHYTDSPSACFAVQLQLATTGELNPSPESTKRKGNTHEHAVVANALARLSANKRQTGRRDFTDSAKEPTGSAAATAYPAAPHPEAPYISVTA